MTLYYLTVWTEKIDLNLTWLGLSAKGITDGSHRVARLHIFYGALSKTSETRFIAGRFTCHPDLQAEGLLAHQVLHRDGVDPCVGALRGGNQQLGGAVAVANSDPLCHGDVVFQPEHLGQGHGLQPTHALTSFSVRTSFFTRWAVRGYVWIHVSFLFWFIAACFSVRPCFPHIEETMAHRHSLVVSI